MFKGGKRTTFIAETVSYKPQFTVEPSSSSLARGCHRVVFSLKCNIFARVQLNQTQKGWFTLINKESHILAQHLGKN